MKQFNSIFYKKNKLMLVSFFIYSILAILIILVLIIGTYNQYYLQCIGLAVFVLFMVVRAAYLIFEKVIVDPESKSIIMKLLKKKIDIRMVKSIKKVRKGQVRVITADNKQIPLSVDEETEFITLVQSLNSNIYIQ